MDNLTQLVADIQTTYSSNLNMITAIYDLQGAYDNVHIPTLISKLESLGVSSSVCVVIYRYLVNRTIIVKGTDGNSTPRTTSKGVPQGSVLSPLLFLVEYSKSPPKQLPLCRTILWVKVLEKSFQNLGEIFSNV